MTRTVPFNSAEEDQAVFSKPSSDKIGRYTHRTTCRFCHSEQLAMFLDLGYVPLAGALLRKDQIPMERFYPLQACFCRTCTLVQVDNAVPRESLFGEYFFYSSVMTTLVEHFAQLAAEVHARFLPLGKSLVVEIGCNDGALLKPLAARGIRCVGVDPASNVTRSIRGDRLLIINDFFGERVTKRICEEHGEAAVILSSYSFAHIDDMDDVMRGIKTLLKRDGVFIVEIHYLPTLLEEMQYDMIYHEHFSYYSLMALTRFFARYDMEVFDVKSFPRVRGGTKRFYVRHVGGLDEPISEAVGTLLERERAQRLDQLETYLGFAARVHQTKRELLALLERLKAEGKRIIGYGASGRATTIMNFCGIDDRYLDYVADDTPAKQGMYTPGTHLVIKPWAATEESPRPDYALAFVWSFIDEVVQKRAEYLQRGGRFIVPLPRVKMIPE